MDNNRIPSTPSTKIEQKPYELGTQLKKYQTKWDQILEELTTAQDEMKGGDVFAKIDYLTFCDQFCKNIYMDITNIDSKSAELQSLKSKFQSNEITLEFIDNILNETQEFKQQMKKKLENVNEEYTGLAEQTLRSSQDLIDNFSNVMETEKVTPTLLNEVKQDLDKEMFLQEIKDSLETLREAREDYLSEEIPASLRTAEGMIPEDLGEEDPQVDGILSQLDTAITSCDLALMNHEITD